MSSLLEISGIYRSNRIGNSCNSVSQRPLESVELKHTSGRHDISGAHRHGLLLVLEAHQHQHQHQHQQAAANRTDKP